MEKKVFLTQAGYDRLEEELNTLKVVSRRNVAEKIKVAREFGDITENSEYDTAKNEQSTIEGRILEIEQKLRLAVIIDEEKLDTSVVNIGSTVKIYDLTFDEEIVYDIVGTTEANIEENKISNESPVGSALIGKKAGDSIKVETPGGIQKYKILEINVGKKR